MPNFFHNQHTLEKSMSELYNLTPRKYVLSFKKLCGEIQIDNDRRLRAVVNQLLKVVTN